MFPFNNGSLELERLNNKTIQGNIFQSRGHAKILGAIDGMVQSYNEAIVECMYQIYHFFEAEQCIKYHFQPLPLEKKFQKF